MSFTQRIRAGLGKELRPMLSLAVPVVIAELGWMSMSVVDTIMVGRLGPEAIGAVSIGAVLFYTVGVFGAGMLLGLDTLVPQAYGAGDLTDCHHSLVQAVYGSLAMAPLLMLPMFALLPWMDSFGLDPEVARLAGPYTRALLWSAPPLLLYMTFRQYLQGMDRVKAVMFTLISANVVNALANWALIFGNLGAPELGVAGAGWASCASRVYMCVALLGYMLYDARKKNTGLLRISLRLDFWRLRLGATGLPGGDAAGLEIGVFALATAIVGTLDAISLASHQIALQAASVSFMVPLGVSSAAAVRVGQALGRGDPEGAHRAGWTALGIGGVFMLVTGALFFLFPEAIIGIFTVDPQVVALGVTLLYIAAFFQLFDGFQVVATGALRGAGDTQTPLIANLVGHWFLGLPVGWALCFQAGWGASGIWSGLSLGLISVGGVLAYFWSTRLEGFQRWVAETTSGQGR
jgi:multidrug resistance protein, MATE family